MSKRQSVSYVVYKMALDGPLAGPNAVCEQAEWDEMEATRPGRHLLIQSGIATEAEAERVARESAGGTAERQPRLKARRP